MLKYIIILFLVGCSSEQLVFELPTLNDSSSKSVATKSSNTTQTTEALPETPLTLNVALAQARDNSPALRASRFRLEAQQQRLKVAGRLPNPEFAIKTEAQPLGSNASSTSTSDSGDTLIGFSQTVPLGGQAATARAIETEAFRALQLRHDGLALELESKVRGAFATALSLQQAALLQTQQLQRLNQLLDLRQALIDAGELIPSDDLELRVQHSNLGAELVQIRRNQRLAQDELTARMGLVQSPTLALLGDLNATLDLPHLNDLLDQLIDTPVVAEAFSQAQVAHLRAQLAKANRVPDINLELFYRQTADGQDAFDAAVLFQLRSMGAPHLTVEPPKPKRPLRSNTHSSSFKNHALRWPKVMLNSSKRKPRFCGIKMTSWRLLSKKQMCSSCDIS